MNTDRERKVYAKAAKLALPGWVSVLLVAAWPLIERYLIPLLLDLFNLRTSRDIDAIGRDSTFGLVHDAARDVDADVVRALDLAEREVPR